MLPAASSCGLTSVKQLSRSRRPRTARVLSGICEKQNFNSTSILFTPEVEMQSAYCLHLRWKVFSFLLPSYILDNGKEDNAQIFVPLFLGGRWARGALQNQPGHERQEEPAFSSPHSFDRRSENFDRVCRFCVFRTRFLYLDRHYIRRTQICRFFQFIFTERMFCAERRDRFIRLPMTLSSW